MNHAATAFQLSSLTAPHRNDFPNTHAQSSMHPQLRRLYSLPSKTFLHRPIVRMSASSANGADPEDSDNTNSEVEFVLSTPAVAKEKLLRIITELINDDSQIKEVERLIHQLESLRATPVTEQFTEMGLAGDWKLVFSSTRTRTQGNVRIRKIGQIFDTENKSLINRARWSFAARNGSDQIMADLFVICSYRFVAPGRLEVEVKEHKVQILDSPDGEKHDMPEDLQALLTELQLALPVDFFDPSGLLDVSYIEPHFRLARFIGKRIAGVRNVFIRDR